MDIAKLSIAFAVFVVSFTACGNKEKKQIFEEDNNVDFVMQNQNSTVFGLCGDGSSEDSLQLITDSGDTLLLGVYGAKDNGKLFSDYTADDKMTVLLDERKKNITLAINENVLLGNWVMLNPLDGSSYVGISFRDGGIAESIDQSIIIYKTWRILDGKLEISLVREGGGDMEEVNAYNIIKLDSDSLIYEEGEDRMEYFREGIVQPE